MDRIEDILGVLFVVAIWVAQAMKKVRDRRKLEAPAPAPALLVPAPARVTDPEVTAALAALQKRALDLALVLEQQRNARRFQPAAREWLPEQLAWIRSGLAQGTLDELSARRALAELRLVADELERLAADRRDARLAAALGDADALAIACYAPIMTHARAEGLPLTVAEPAARWGSFDLAIWTGFIPTGVAPLFLPRGFFDSPLWWPAIAHEIGHSVLASVRGLERGLREELGLASEAAGLRPLRVEDGTLASGELERVVGGWFEELFCDVFGAMMCGPGYVRSMTTLFAAQNDAREVLAAFLDASGRRYDSHPPRHLRVITACHVLARAGLHDDARTLRAEWEARHTVGETRPDRILFPYDEAFLAIPLAPLEALVTGLADRLYEGPFDALGGNGLQDISGLDYGPHEHQESRRARDALLGGRVPRARDARAVIAGAVLASYVRPAEDVKILALARAAIPGAAGEVRPDAYQVALAPLAPLAPGAAATPATSASAANRAARATLRGAISAAELRDAIVLSTLLERPRSVRPRGRELGRGRGHAPGRQL